MPPTHWPAVSYAPMAGLPEITIPPMSCCFGMEDTIEAYVGHMVLVWRGLWRALRGDGVGFLNLGDSYSSSSGHNATSYDNSDKELEDYQGRGCLCENLCDVCRVVFLRKSHTYDLLVPMLIASLSGPTHGYKELQNGHFPTSDFPHQVNRIFRAMPDLLNSQDHGGERLRAFRESMPDEFSRQLLGECWQRGNSSVCLLCARSLISDVQECARKSDDFFGQSLRTGGNALYNDQLKPCSQYKDKVCDYCNGFSYSPSYIQPHYTTGDINPQTNALPPKNLMGIPWRCAFALQADGWYLRSDVIWAKKNGLPESVRDRPTKAHEYVFLLAKSERYWWDQEAIREPLAETSFGRKERKEKLIERTGAGTLGKQIKDGIDESNGYAGLAMGRNGKSGYNPAGRNKRTVWELSSQPLKAAHFAVMPEALVEPCLLAGCPAQVCAECGEPWVRVVEREGGTWEERKESGVPTRYGLNSSKKTAKNRFGDINTKTIAHTPTCQCNGHFEEQMIPDYYDWEETAEAKKKVVRVYVPDISLSAHVTRPGVVLDPFFGSGTVGVVAKKFKREWAGIELNPDYAEMARKRLDQTQPALFAR